MPAPGTADQSTAGWWQASDGRFYPPQSAPAGTATPAAMAVPPAAWPILAGSAAMIIGAFLPWAKLTAPFVGTVELNGIEGDGVFTLIAGVLVAVLGFPLLARRTTEPTLGIPILIVAVVAGALSAYDLVNVERAVGDLEGAVVGSAGIGLYLTGLGAFASAVEASCFCSLAAEPPGIARSANTCSTGRPVDRHDLDQLRRSMAAIPPGQPALHREQAVRLLEELSALQARHDALVAELRRLVDDAGRSF